MRNASAATQFRTLVVSDSPYAVVSAFLKEQADVHLTVERVYHDDVATFTDVLARFSDSAPAQSLPLPLPVNSNPNPNSSPNPNPNPDPNPDSSPSPSPNPNPNPNSTQVRPLRASTRIAPSGSPS